MILWAVLLISHCCWSLNTAAASLERIEHCGTRCYQGLRCKTKPGSLARASWFQPPCQKPAEGLNSSSVFQSVSLSTVMRCEGKQKCSLQLRMKTELQLTEAIHGLSICTVIPGMIANCRIVSFSKGSREKMSGMQVAIENDCTEVAPGQNLKTRVTTVPHYCNVVWTGSYDVPRCSHEDLSRHVPDCITGRLSYDMNPQRKELNVSVSDMRQDHDYNLRLCHKDFICTGTGARTLIKKEDPVKSATFQYERLLPCLCIEGWSAVTDAPRIQVCPFKDNLEELWSGISFEPLEGKLSWVPSCHVTAVVALCEIQEDGMCVDLPNSSQNVSREKIAFTEVDPHPQLCMKFTAGSQSWTKCPFLDARFKVWELSVSHEGRHVMVSSLTSATFSVRLCANSNNSTVCRVTETHTIHVDKHKAERLNLEGKLCNSCLQVRRLDVMFAPTVLQCHSRCNQSSLLTQVITSHATGDLTWVVPAGVLLCAIIVVSLVLHLLLKGHRRKKQTKGRSSAKI